MKSTERASTSEDTDLDDLLWVIAETARQVRGRFTIYVIVLGYGVFAVTTPSDRQIIFNEAVTLPFLEMEVSLWSFFIAVPLLSLVLFVHIQMYLQRLRRLVGDVMERDDADPRRLYPWLATMQADPEPGLMGTLQRWYVQVVLWGLLPAGLTCLGVSAARTHDVTLATTVLFIVTSGVAVTVYFWSNYENQSIWTTWAGRGVAAGACLLIIGLSGLNVAAYEGWMLPLDFRRERLITVRDTSQHEYWADLKQAQLQGSDLRRAVLTRANLRGADLRRVDARRATFADAQLADAMLQEADLMFADLTGVDFSGARLDKVTLAFASVTGASFEDARLDGADLGGVRGLRKATLRGASFNGANLSGMDLGGGDFTEVYFDEANLASSTFRGADLRLASFRGAKLKGVNFTGANVSKTDLTNATGLTYKALCPAASVQGLVPSSLRRRAIEQCPADSTSAQ